MIRTFGLVLLVFISVSSASAMDLEVSSRFENLYWGSVYKNNTDGYTFRGADLFWNLQGSVTQELADGLLFKGGFENDPVLRWRAYGQLAFGLDNLTMKFTPFIGTFNSTQKWFNPGMEAMVEYTWPGFLFLKGGFLTTFAPVSKEGDYYLTFQTAAVGTLVENGIITFTVEDKAATFRAKDNLTTVDASTRYWLDTEMFLKNFPVRMAILTGYQVLSRRYIAAAEVLTPIHSFLLGGRFSWDFGAGTVVFAQVESAFFNAGWDSTVMALPSTTPVFQSVTGVRYHW